MLRGLWPLIIYKTYHTNSRRVFRRREKIPPRETDIDHDGVPKCEA